MSYLVKYQQYNSRSIIKNNYWSPYIVGILLGLVLLVITLLAFTAFWAAEKVENKR